MGANIETSGLRVKHLGRIDYSEALQRMLEFNAHRTVDCADEIWLLEHFPVFTRGVSCTLDPHSNPTQIPVIDSDRGGQITYHGPGQLIAYLLFDLKRHRRGVRRLVHDIEESIIVTLEDFGIEAKRRTGAPGVYVDGRKIASLGLRVRSGYTYHGLSLNIDMDLKPFTLIDPCGIEDLEVVNVVDCLATSEKLPVGSTSRGSMEKGMRDALIDTLVRELSTRAAKPLSSADHYE